MNSQELATITRFHVELTEAMKTYRDYCKPFLASTDGEEIDSFRRLCFPLVTESNDKLGSAASSRVYLSSFGGLLSDSRPHHFKRKRLSRVNCPRDREG